MGEEMDSANGNKRVLFADGSLTKGEKDGEERIIRRKNSFLHDPRVVEKTRDPAFFFLEPGAGVILLGFLLEPDKFKQSLAWIFTLLGGVALSSQKPLLAKILSVLAMIKALRPFGSTRYIIFLFGMCTVMRSLRVIEVLMNPKYFEERGVMYTIKFVFLYHDLRRATIFDDRESQDAQEKQDIKDIISSVAGIAAVVAALRVPQVQKSRMITSFFSMLRFYYFVALVESGYRIQLTKFGIKAPKNFDEPWKSETIREFWGKRWNQAIAQQLRNIFFVPLANAGYQAAGEFGVFLASSGIHMIPIVTLGGDRWAIGSTALFFILQPLMIALEKTFQLKGRLWVQASMWSIAHFFSIPLYQVM